MAKIPQFDNQILRELCDILGDTGSGLTSSEIGQLLAQCQIEDPYPTMTKRYRLFEALRQRQEQDGCGNNVVAFICSAMNPVRYSRNPERFNYLRNELNKALFFAGYELGEDGKLQKTLKVRTPSEAEERASRLAAELRRRNVHPDVLRFCRAELLQENYFHAVLEATKSLAGKIRQKTGLTADGSKLIDQTFGLSEKGIPRLAFNSLQTDTERSEHIGLMHIMKGIFSAFRNPTAHTPRIFWQLNERDALDILLLCCKHHF